MRKTRFTETEIVAILKEADSGMPVKDLCRMHEISHASCHHWKAKPEGMEAAAPRRNRQPNHHPGPTAYSTPNTAFHFLSTLSISPTYMRW